MSPVNVRVSVRTEHAFARKGPKNGHQAWAEDHFGSGEATAPMQTCHGSHSEYAPGKPLHRTSRDPPEREFYILQPDNKSDQMCHEWQVSPQRT